MERLSFWIGKKVQVTGHTGFMGAWLTQWLTKLDAEVSGYSLKKYDNDTLYKTLKLKKKIKDYRGNIGDYNSFKKVMDKVRPEIIFHLAAQPLVRKSYDNPLETIQSNVVGTANVLEAIRNTKSVKAAVIVTSDKCYKNLETGKGYMETDPMGGHDPYSASKGCAELLVDSYRNSFFRGQKKLVSTARAGNVIGGGDFAKDRLMTDCIKALEKGERIRVRNPKSTRPWQHVLEPVEGYLTLAEKMIKHKRYDEAWNFGPGVNSVYTVSEVVDKVIKNWGSGKWADTSKKGDKHEAKLLNLDITKAKTQLGWHPKLKIEEAIALTIEGYKSLKKGEIKETIDKQIEEYEAML
ncbi:MAG: CDP-glucose 4,6-dehydratase [Candidatus Altiarchaeota archaeon]|nr:CDP-glucose 4,6-dehydratase [Candidatus Altiarchaeota archaeon]